MKVVVAIDSLKGSLSSLEAGEAIKSGVHMILILLILTELYLPVRIVKESGIFMKLVCALFKQEKLLK